MSEKEGKGKRVLVTIPQGTWEIIEKELKGKLGDKDAEILRNIIISWLIEHGFIDKKPREGAKEEIEPEKGDKES